MFEALHLLSSNASEGPAFQPLGIVGFEAFAGVQGKGEKGLNLL